MAAYKTIIQVLWYFYIYEPELLLDLFPAPPSELEREEGRRMPFLLSVEVGRDLSLPDTLLAASITSSGAGELAPRKFQKAYKILTAYNEIHVHAYAEENESDSLKY